MACNCDSKFVINHYYSFKFHLLHEGILFKARTNLSVWMYFMPEDHTMIKEALFLHCRVPQDHSTPTLHGLCTTVPARVLPTDLYLASRVYHTADKKGHDTLLRVFGKSLLDDHFTDEEQRDR